MDLYAPRCAQIGALERLSGPGFHGQFGAGAAMVAPRYRGIRAVIIPSCSMRTASRPKSSGITSPRFQNSRPFARQRREFLPKHRPRNQPTKGALPPHPRDIWRRKPACCAACPGQNSMAMACETRGEFSVPRRFDGCGLATKIDLHMMPPAGVTHAPPEPSGRDKSRHYPRVQAQHPPLVRPARRARANRRAAA